MNCTQERKKQKKIETKKKETKKFSNITCFTINSIQYKKSECTLTIICENKQYMQQSIKIAIIFITRFNQMIRLVISRIDENASL